jgi:hypothetical protein
MPLALDPNQTFKIILESDKDKPARLQPCFVYSYLTGRQWLAVASLQDQLDDLTAADQIVDKVFQAASTGLVGWENMIDRNGEPVEFNIDTLDMIVGVIEAQELIVKLLKQHPNLDDKKKLELQSDLNTEQSVKIAKE